MLLWKPREARYSITNPEVVLPWHQVVRLPEYHQTLIWIRTASTAKGAFIIWTQLLKNYLVVFANWIGLNA